LLVCHCHQICDRTIRECIRDGARSIDEVGRSCEAGTGCGGCRPAIGALLTEARAPEPRRLFTVLVEQGVFSLAC
jgi:bacterioferritin-associated ferredoxin